MSKSPNKSLRCTRDQLVTVKMTAYEKNDVLAAADSYSMTLSTYVRWILTSASRDRLKEIGETPES